MEGCQIFQDTNPNDAEINAMADRLAAEIRALQKEIEVLNGQD